MAVSFSSDVATKDAVMADCCGTCEAPILVCHWSDTNSVCWPLGDVSAMKGSFISEKDPAKGVVLRYGKTNCCYRGPGEAPGLTRELDLELTIVPDPNVSESNEMDLDWRVIRLLSISSLQNCSVAVAGKITSEIALRDYYQRLVYKLSPSKSNFSCTVFWGKGDSAVTLQCEVFPAWASNSSLAPSSVCLRLQLRFLYSNGSHNLASLSDKANHHSDQCKFTVSRNKNMTSVEVLDSDGTPIGSSYNISAPSSFNHESFWNILHIAFVSAAVGVVGIVIAAVTVAIVKWYKRRDRGNSQDGSTNPDDEGSSLLDNRDNEQREEGDNSGTENENREPNGATNISNPNPQRQDKDTGTQVEMLDTLNGLEDQMENIGERMSNLEQHKRHSGSEDKCTIV